MAKGATEHKPAPAVPEVQALAQFQERLEDFRRRKIHARVVIDLEYGCIAHIEFHEKVRVTGS